jgi:hypothetical protein
VVPCCTFSLATDNVALFGYNPAIEHSLCELCGDWDGWRGTLQFRSGEPKV